jgi:hypothetical protein
MTKGPDPTTLIAHRLSYIFTGLVADWDSIAAEVVEDLRSAGFEIVEAP